MLGLSEFFKTLWDASEGDYMYAPTMLDGIWNEGVGMDLYSLYWSINEQARGVDQYFTPLKYNGLRKKGLMGNPGVIFADIDNPDSRKFRLAPSIVVATSPGHAHVYWLLNSPVEPIEWAPKAKGWTAEIGADPGGWDATQVLRVPGTLNNKYDPPKDVWLHTLEPSVRYDLDDFPTADLYDPEVSDTPVPDRSRGAKTLNEGIRAGSVPLGSVYWLTASEEDLKALGTIDRSRVLWQQERILFEAGFTPTQVFDLLYHAGINKWKGQPLKLWREVNKAAGYSSGTK